MITTSLHQPCPHQGMGAHMMSWYNRLRRNRGENLFVLFADLCG